jgi:hypothetical protein
MEDDMKRGLKNGHDDVDWIRLAQRYGPVEGWISWAAERMSDSQLGLCSV